MMRALLDRLRRNQRGVAAIEFALLAPVMIVLIIGSIETSHYVLVKIALDGAVSTAARESVADLKLTDEQRDAKMRTRITTLMSGHRPAPGHSVTISTTVYRRIGDSYPEGYEDLNNSGSYETGEPFDDRNRNNVRDMSTPVAGKMGDVGDVVGYNVVYPTAPYFDLMRPVFGDRIDLTTSTVARNEPERGAIVP